jgi:hypothetical protein
MTYQSLEKWKFSSTQVEVVYEAGIGTSTLRVLQYTRPDLCLVSIVCRSYEKKPDFA